MADDNLLLIAGLAVAGFLLYNKINPTLSPTSAASLLRKQNYDAQPYSNDQIRLIDRQPDRNTSYFFNYNDLNFAQKTLLGLGLPTRWILE